MARLLRFALLSLMLLALAPSSALAARNVSIVSGHRRDGLRREHASAGPRPTRQTTTTPPSAQTRSSPISRPARWWSTPEAAASRRFRTARSPCRPRWIPLTLRRGPDAERRLEPDRERPDGPRRRPGLNSPLATSISQPINPGSLLTDGAGENFITADISAVGQVQFGGHTSSLDATVDQPGLQRGLPRSRWHLPRGPIRR